MNALIGNAVYGILETFCPRVGNTYIEERTKMPYLVYTCLSMGHTSDVQNNLVLEVNIWDNKGSDIEELEQISDAMLNIYTGVDKRIYDDGDTYLKFDLESVLDVPTGEEELRRKQHTYRVRYIDRRYERR